MLEYYHKQLGEIPHFLEKYFECPSLERLKGISYFCGMDYASKEMYQFNEHISRFDHSVHVALIVYRLTHDKEKTVAGLLHDIATPCFSHAIDYMNKDYDKQESTEEFTEEIIRNDSRLLHCLEEDGLNPERVANFKDYSVVDIDRPKMCADRLDGVISPGIVWSKNISKEDIAGILHSMMLFVNEDGEEEIGFNSLAIGNRIIDISDSIDLLTHTKEDQFMMSLLGDIARRGIEIGLFTYQDLFRLTEDEIFSILNSSNDVEIQVLLNRFYTVSKDEVPDIDIPNVKKKVISPYVVCQRLVK